MSGKITRHSNELDRLDRVRTAAAFWRELEDVVGDFGISFYIYLLQRQDGTLFHRTNLPDGTYGGAERDPFLKYCCNNMGVALVGAGYEGRYPYMTEDEKAFVSLAAEAGWTSGIAIPVRQRHHSEYGGFNFGSRMPGADFESAIQPHVDRLRALALFAHQKIQELGILDDAPSTDAPELDSLTERQRTIFAFMHEGLGRAEIASRAGISPLTVATHQKAIYRKLGVHSQRELMSLRSED